MSRNTIPGLDSPIVRMEERRSLSSRGDLIDIQYLCALHTTASLLTSACVAVS
jgi:hypothetical protein